MQQRSKKARLVYFIVFAIVFLLCVPYVMFLSFGYDIGDNFSIFKTGGIYVYSSEVGADVYVDGKLDDSTSIFQHGILIKKLFKGKYFIVVSKEGYVDWQKNVNVVEEQVAEAYSLLIPKTPIVTDVLPRVPKTSATSSPLVDNPEYATLTALFVPKKAIPVTPKDSSIIATTSLPSITSGKTTIEKYEGGLRAVWQGHSSDSPFYFCTAATGICQKSFIVYTANNIGTFEFFPARNDVLLVAVQSRIYAVELDRRLPQNIILLYSGSGASIDFRILNNETLAIKDGKAIKKLSLVYEK